MMMACEAAGIADLARWFDLPAWSRSMWIAHAANKVEGRYTAPATVPKKPGGCQADPNVLAMIERQRQGAG